MAENWTLTANSTGNDSFLIEDEKIFPQIVQITQIILFSIVCLVGLVGNTLVIYVVIRFSKMQTVTNMYIVNLAIADELFLIGIPFLIATIVHRHWIFGNFICKAYMITTSINQFTSSILLCIMSADRYIAVCHPISSPKWRTPFISKVVSLLAWTFSICLIIPIIRYAQEIPVGEQRSCIIAMSDLNGTADFSEEIADAAKIFTLYTFICGFTIPLCLILVFYYLVLKKLKTVGPKNKSKEKRRSHRKVTSLVLTVVTVYVFCWLPYWITQLAINGNDDKYSVTIHLLASCLSYSNSAINPILYAFLSDNFKKSFMKACTCAANRDINATLQLENSVFPKKNKNSERFRPTRTRGTSLGANMDDEGDAGPLVCKNTDPSSSTAVTLTCRNTTVQCDAVTRNGTIMSQPTSL